MNQPLIAKDITLAPHTSFRIGGKADYFCQADSVDELTQCVEFAREKKLPIFVLGGGTNVVINDAGYRGLVIKLLWQKVVATKNRKHTLITAGAGKKWDNLVLYAVNRGLQGIECLSGIPGSVGAAPVQNIGAYGQQLSDVLFELEVYDTKTGKVDKISNKDCHFGYRDSLFKHASNINRFIVLSVTLRLKSTTVVKPNYQSLVEELANKGIDNPSIKQVRTAVLSIRDSKLENYAKVPNAGSFFQNPLVSRSFCKRLSVRYPKMSFFPAGDKVKLSAGWLIEKAGWKGKKYKKVGVSAKHALVLVNPKRLGTARQLNELATRIQKDVYEKFGVNLQREVQYIGFN